MGHTKNNRSAATHLDEKVIWGNGVINRRASQKAQHLKP